MKILIFFVIFSLKILELNSFVIKIEFKLLKNSSEFELNDILDTFAKLNKTTETTPSTNLTQEAFLLWNKFIDLEKLNFTNQTKEDKVLKQLIELSPFKDLVESAKKKIATTTFTTSTNPKTIPTTTTIITTTTFPSTTTNINRTYINTTYTTVESTSFLNTTTSINNNSIYPIKTTSFTPSPTLFLLTTTFQTPLKISNSSTLKKTTILETPPTTETTLLTTFSTVTTPKSTILNTLSEITSTSTTQKTTNQIVTSSTSLFSTENLSCTPNFCLNFGQCHLNYLQEPTCTCLDYRLVYYELLIQYFSGSNCENITYSVTQLGLVFSVVLISLIFFLLILICTKLWKCICCRNEREAELVEPNCVEYKNEAYDPDEKDMEKKVKNNKFKKNSWKYIKMNYNLRKKTREKKLYVKQKIKYQISSGTIQKLLDKHARNVFRSMEGLMHLSYGNKDDLNEQDENFIIVKKNLNSSLPNFFATHDDAFTKDSFSLSLSKLDTLCSSNVCVYPKPNRNTNNQNGFNQNENEVTFVNGAIFY
ncbi:unnamed protein product [Brachionus calyciflorus]|uniref:EGF-like domain-containing protein n=1 Tax=Brachionus calyciflorus TaxID=104777 RepID=A0A814GI04_9BILA|nr:unnamed protein product [Brachionus calyciflorus]